MSRNHHESVVRFGLFDPKEEREQSERNLPHWFQPGVAAFITFRTADSLPRDVLESWDREIRNWLSRHDVIVPHNVTTIDVDSLSLSLRKPFLKYREKRLHWHLDQCHGECVLRQMTLAQIVADALLYFNGDRYQLDRFIVMPNHVHLLGQFLPPTDLRQQCTSWLHFTAVEINRMLARRGKIWQAEPFDHLVRSARQFEYLQDYIADNPKKAKLKTGEFLYWCRQ